MKLRIRKKQAETILATLEAFTKRLCCNGQTHTGRVEVTYADKEKRQIEAFIEEIKVALRIHYVKNNL